MMIKGYSHSLLIPVRSRSMKIREVTEFTIPKRYPIAVVSMTKITAATAPVGTSATLREPELALR